MPFQLACSIARNVSNAARAAAGDLSLMMSTAPSADSLFQSWRSFLRVEPDRLMPNSVVTNGLAPVDSTSGAMPRADSALSTAVWLGVSVSNDIRLIIFGSRRFISTAASSAGITSSTWAGSTTGLDRKA